MTRNIFHALGLLGLLMIAYSLGKWRGYEQAFGQAEMSIHRAADEICLPRHSV